VNKHLYLCHPLVLSSPTLMMVTWTWSNCLNTQMLAH